MTETTRVHQKRLASYSLIVFTRYPEPGKTKTRLIPALGPEGAASVQKQMTEWMLQQVRELLSGPLTQHVSVAVEVRFAGGDRPAMEHWLGQDWSYVEQGDGDLGKRLERAFASAFDRGAQKVLVIGIDCPSITADVLARAYAGLDTHEGVIGPAVDGGYYLIGLTRPCPALFYDIPWGTETVRSQTLAVGKKLALEFTLLDQLPDVDRPEDLRIWQTLSGWSPPQIPGQISIIIPTLNEAHYIQRTLQHLLQTSIEPQGSNLDVIVVDGGSDDQTKHQVAALKGDKQHLRFIGSAPGRAIQMNAGATIATGEYILFLHADTQLPADFATWIPPLLSSPTTVAGAFRLRINAPNALFRLIEWGVRLRTQTFQLPYGDQALFLRTETFHSMGGFPQLPLMEDVELVRKLRRRGRITVAPTSVITSARRWQTLGIIRTTLMNLAILGGYWLGVSPARLATWYSKDRSISEP